MELTLELSQHKWPQPTELPKLFNDNLRAMLELPLAAGFGGLRRASPLLFPFHRLRDIAPLPKQS
jgi:hypothetical protein